MAASRGRRSLANLMAVLGLLLLLAAAGGGGVVPFLVALAGLGLLLAATVAHNRELAALERRDHVDGRPCALCPHVRAVHRRDDASCAFPGCRCPRYLVEVGQVGDLVEANLLDLGPDPEGDR